MRKGMVAVMCLVGAVWLGVAVGTAAAAVPPPNDDLANAQPFVGPLSFAQAENEGATTEPGESAPQGISGGASVWFDWTAEKSGGAEFSACWGNDGLRPLVGVYTGEAVGALTPAPRIFGNGGCEYGFQAIAGVTYRVQVEGELDPVTGVPTTGEADLDLRRFPFNDDFEAAEDLGSWISIGTSSEWGNLGATKQPGEPDHDGDPGGSSVWFTWTAPATGEVEVSACAATFAPLLAAYTGTSVAALTPVAAGSGEPGLQCNASFVPDSQLRFRTVAGTRYDLAVDGRGGASGTFQLNVEMDPKTQQALGGERSAGGPPPLPQTQPAKVKPTAQIVVRRVDQGRRSVLFSLHSAQSGAQFRCKLDRRRVARCGAQVTYRHLAAGRHVFRALAVGPTGATGAPVKAAFAIRRSG